MANSIGGKILIGVDDNGGLAGLPNLNRQKSEFQSCARTLDPPLSVEVDAVGNVLMIRVPESKTKPHAAGGKFYLLSGSNTQQMNRNELKEFFFKEGLIYFDESPNKKLTYDKNLSRKAFSNFRKLAGLPASLNMEHILENLKLLESGTMTNAGVILLSSEITSFLLSASTFVNCSVGSVNDRTHGQFRTERHAVFLLFKFYFYFRLLFSDANICIIPFYGSKEFNRKTCKYMGSGNL